MVERRCRCRKSLVPYSNMWHSVLATVQSFRATGITAYLKNGGRLEIAQQMAAHESARTTGLYDRRSDEVSLDEVERIGI